MKNKIINIILILILLITIIISSFIKEKREIEPEDPYINIYKLKTNKKENYLFYGDSLTMYYPIDIFFEDLQKVNTGTNSYRLEEMKDNNHNLVEVYNPTHIIIETGVDEVVREEKNEIEIYNGIINIIKQIKKDRPYAKIYLESLYPTRDIEKNKKIKNINKMLKEYTKDKKIKYINIYPHLLENNLLKKDYAEDEIHLTENAYARVSTHIRAALKNEKSNYNNVYNINPEKNEKIVFIGDSLTDFYPINEYFENINIINNGISGYTTADLLERLNEFVYEEKPSKVFLNIGINDMSKTEETQEEIFNNINLIISNIKKNCPETKIYLESLYPINNSNDQKIKQSAIESRNMKEINYINKKLKEKYKDSDVTYINVYNKLLDNNNLLKLTYTIEGLHLTNTGYNKVSEVLLPYIAE